LLRAQTPEAVAVMDPGLVALCGRGESVTQEEYVAAVTRRAALGAALRLFFDRFDLLLSPTMPIPAAFADPRDDDLPNPNNFPSWAPYTSPFNLTKNPSCSIPCSFSAISRCCRPAAPTRRPRAPFGRARSSRANSIKLLACLMPASAASGGQSVNNARAKNFAVESAPIRSIFACD
jgi:Amidase